jgi:coenzyme F420-reducing hydrogenase gamma subunit
MDKKKIGWFSFTCCEDSTVMFAEILNDHYKDWLPKMEFVHARILRKEVSTELQPMDIAFVEGAISSDEQEEKLKKIREKAKVLVAIGSCAVLGSPSNQRNNFDDKKMEQIAPILEKFRYKDKVKKLADIVTVDSTVPGCPMNEKLFVDLINKFLAE